MKLEDIERLRNNMGGSGRIVSDTKEAAALLDLAQWALENRPQWDERPSIGDSYWADDQDDYLGMVAPGRVLRSYEPTDPRGFLRCRRPTPWKAGA